MFEGKKVLFFSASFFGYQLELRKKLEALGAQVKLYDERPKNTFWYKTLIRLDKRLLIRRIERYYKNILIETANTDYDYIFFLKAEVITYKMLSKLKDDQKNAKCILYMWDSIKNCPSVERLFPLFDKILSFDRKDVETHTFLNFRPLFYLDDYSRNANSPGSIKYDISFVGTGHTDRYQIVRRVKEFCRKEGLKGYFFMYLQDYRIYYLRKLFSKAFRKARKNEFGFHPLSKPEIVQIIQESRCILDIERAVQCGLTMRCIEVLGAGKKLITTNKDIIHYDFYHQNNILVIDRDDPVPIREFVTVEYKDIDFRIYQNYSIGHWLHDVFS